MKFWAKWIATAGGIGFFPIAPATAGSVVGVLIYWRGPVSLPARLAVAFVLLCLGFWSAGYAQEIFRQKDPKPVIIDEISAMYLALLLQAAVGPAQMIEAFLVFRILDVFKPFGIRRLEALPGALGIMADDIAAAVLGALLLRAFTK